MYLKGYSFKDYVLHYPVEEKLSSIEVVRVDGQV